MAALLLVVDSLPFVHAFPGKPLIYNIVWKSSLYIAASLVYRYVKPLLKYLFQGMSLPGAASGALQQFLLARRWGIEIWLAMLLVVYVTIKELARVIERDQLKEMFLGAEASQPRRDTLAMPHENSEISRSEREDSNLPGRERHPTAWGAGTTRN